MPENTPAWINELIAFLTKAFVLTSFVAITIKMAIQMDREKLTLKKVFWAYITGMGIIILVSPLINAYIESSWQIPIAGLVAISGEKIGVYIIYKWNIELFLSSLADFLLSKVKGDKKE